MLEVGRTCTFSSPEKACGFGERFPSFTAHSGVLGRAAVLTGVPFRTQTPAPHLTGRAHVLWLCPESLQAHGAPALGAPMLREPWSTAAAAPGVRRLRQLPRLGSTVPEMRTTYFSRDYEDRNHT